jgi:hypothetical protein
MMGLQRPQVVNQQEKSVMNEREAWPEPWVDNAPKLQTRMASTVRDCAAKWDVDSITTHHCSVLLRPSK